MAITRSGGGGGSGSGSGSDSGGHCGRQGRRNLKNSTTADAGRQGESPFGSCADSDLILWLKRLAVNPCNYGASKESGGRLWDQLLKLRKIMFLTHSEFPQVISNVVFSPPIMSSLSIQSSYHTCVVAFSFSQ